MVVMQVIVNGRVVATGPLALGMCVQTQVVEVPDPPTPAPKPEAAAPPAADSPAGKTG